LTKQTHSWAVYHLKGTSVLRIPSEGVTFLYGAGWRQPFETDWISTIVVLVIVKYELAPASLPVTTLAEHP